MFKTVLLPIPEVWCSSHIRPCCSWACFMKPYKEYHVVEQFAGVAHPSRYARAAGMKAAACDKTYNPKMDINCDSGFGSLALLFNSLVQVVVVHSMFVCCFKLRLTCCHIRPTKNSCCLGPQGWCFWLCGLVWVSVQLMGECFSWQHPLIILQPWWSWRLPICETKQQDGG